MSLKKLTLIEALNRSIKMWEWMAEEQERSKIEWFRHHRSVEMWCYICAYYYQKYGFDYTKQCCQCLAEKYCKGANSIYVQWTEAVKREDYKAKRKCEEEIITALKIMKKEVKDEQV